MHLLSCCCLTGLGLGLNILVLFPSLFRALGTPSSVPNGSFSEGRSHLSLMSSEQADGGHRRSEEINVRED